MQPFMKGVFLVSSGHQKDKILYYSLINNEENEESDL